jgi:AcrR family transcriptional regulator
VQNIESKQYQNDDIRLRLIEEARSIFARFGYQKATVDDIAKSVGKGKSTFYYYFASKEEIFKTVLEKEAGIFRGKLIEAISIKESPFAKIKNYILIRLENFKELVNFYNAIRNDGYGPLTIIDEVRDKYDLEQANIIKMMLLESIAKNEVEIEDIELVTEALAVILKGLEYHMIFKPTDGTIIKSKIDKVLDLVFKGIKR